MGCPSPVAYNCATAAPSCATRQPHWAFTRQGSQVQSLYHPPEIFWRIKDLALRPKSFFVWCPKRSCGTTPHPTALRAGCAPCYCQVRFVERRRMNDPAGIRAVLKNVDDMLETAQLGLSDMLEVQRHRRMS